LILSEWGLITSDMNLSALGLATAGARFYLSRALPCHRGPDLICVGTRRADLILSGLGLVTADLFLFDLGLLVPTELILFELSSVPADLI